ncbi:MarR family winged helix-turn-helix transcriptional regulator [Gryllotalpicola reticulitermitis]|uniref:MarR family winged helix-turn-helix transcriptional regulator n=1 Tax=Gryllotalpicola reticulitermitis TaxID=1184153 RepID=A0ABV8Q6F9_9MICO
MAERDEAIARLNQALFGIVRQYDRFRAAFARREGVSVTELRAMSRIVDERTITPKQLAASLDLTTGAVTSLVDRLVEGGRVVRVPHPTDRRSLQLTPTEAGEALMQRVVDDFEGVLRRGTVQIDDEGVNLFGELLEGLVTRARAMPVE